MIACRWKTTLLAVCMLPLVAGCATTSLTAAEPSYEGLVEAQSGRFARAEFRPGVDFTHYNAVQIGQPQLEFRTPDSTAGEFPLTPEQKSRFRDMLAAAFANEFGGDESIAVVDHPGPDVLHLDIRVLDIRATVPPRAVGAVGRGRIALEASGSVTLVIEVRDSRSRELLARGAESRQVAGAAMRRGAEMITLWDDVDALCDRWAAAARTGLDALLAYDGTGR